MFTIHARSALLPEGQRENVRVTVADGMIVDVMEDAAPQPGDHRVGVLIPALGNVHSHAFQRAMAGFAERRGPGQDSFWSWRETMYRFALSMTPDQLEAVAAQLYVEMLEAGFGRVGEFHYLHHAPDGRPYADIGELAGRIAAAARETGIGLTLLPVFYARSGFGGGAPAEGQRRFVNTLESFEALLSACRTAVRDCPGAVVGLAPHSLRAVTPNDLSAVLPLAGNGPIHIHVAEQVKEVEDCFAWSGARPVAWLLDHAEVDARWCLIHATHMTEMEATRLAATGAVAGLCPITEANLGDGIFSATFFSNGGAYAVGSDSNVSISVPGELRQLEYSQRLALRARNVLARPGGSTGAALVAGAVAGAGTALGVPGGIAPGHAADLVSLDLTRVPYLPDTTVLDHWIFADGIGVEHVWAGGRLVVESGRHARRDAVRARFERAMSELIAAA